MKLAQFLFEKKISQKAFADKAKVTQQAVSRWINGTRPEYPQMSNIHELTKGKVSFRDWA